MKGHIIEEAIQKENKCTTTETNAELVEKEPSIYDLNNKNSGTFPVITLSGSLQYIDKIEHLTSVLSAHFVVLPPCRATTKHLNPSKDNIERILTEIHFQKIDMSDALIVVNENDYIGSGTLLEIMHAKSIDIPIYFLYAPKSFVIKSILDHLDIDYSRTPICYILP